MFIAAFSSYIYNLRLLSIITIIKSLQLEVSKLSRIRILIILKRVTGPKGRIWLEMYLKTILSGVHGSVINSVAV
jgi:hypothetical protein